MTANPGGLQRMRKSDLIDKVVCLLEDQRRLKERLSELEQQLQHRNHQLQELLEEKSRAAEAELAAINGELKSLRKLSVSTSVTLFYSYSHKDEDLRDELHNHVALLKRDGVIVEWHDRCITPGNEWSGKIDDHLDSARVILLLVSADFLASEYCCDVEMTRAMERHDAGEAVVIPIILRSVDWDSAEFSKLQALPKDGKPVTSWTNRDEAYTDVARGIRAIVEELRGC